MLPMPPDKRLAQGLNGHAESLGRLLRVNTRTAWIVYTALRLVFFAVPFAVLHFIFVWPWWLALIVAALASLSLSVIFLAKPREAASTGIHEWRNRDRTHDDIAEDDVLDSVGAVDEVPLRAAEGADSADDTPTLSASAKSRPAGDHIGDAREG